MKIKYFFLILLIFSFISCGEEKRVEDHYLIGISHYKNRNYSEALKSFEKDYNLTQNIKSLYKLAEIYFNTNDIFNSELALKKILKVSPKDGFALYKLGVLYKKRGKYNKALNYLVQLLNNNSYKKEAYSYLIEIYLTSNNIKIAEKYYEESLKKFSSSDRIEYLFMVYHFKQKNGKFKKHLENLLSKSENFDILNSCIDLFLSNGKLDLALKTLFTIEKHYKKNVDTLLVIGQIYQRLGNSKKAFEYFTKVELIEPKNFINKINFSVEYLLSNQYKKAERYLQEAIGINTNSFTALILTGLFYYIDDQIEKSDKIIKTVRKNISPYQLKQVKSNPLIKLYLTDINYEKNNSFNKEDFLSIPIGNNSKLLEMKMRVLNNKGYYNDVIELYKKNTWATKNINEQLFISYLIVNKPKEAKNLLNKIEKKDLYTFWYHYQFEKKCLYPKNSKKYEKNPIYIDILTNCLMIEQKFEKAKEILLTYSKNNKLDKDTTEYIRKKILSINYNILKK